MLPLRVTPTPNPSPQGGGGFVGVRRYPQRHSRSFAAAVFFVALSLAVLPARAVEPGEMLRDPALEARARHISQELRCLVCQNQSIDDSNAELARDLRVLVRERLTAGDSDAAVLAFVEARYGEFVLLRPRLSVHTALLWSAPVLLLLIATMVLLRRARSQASVQTGGPSEPLSEAEQQRLDEVLKKTDA
jgi:cytochrome c-type biogenesis protein CcmH